MSKKFTYFGSYLALISDLYPNAAVAYSLRKLRSAYTGSAIRVRRSSDNTEQDFGFTSTGELDTNAIETFVGYNLFAWSEQLQQAYWAKTNLTVTTDALVAPDSTTTGDILYETTTNGAHAIGRTLSATAGKQYTVSFWIQAQGRNNVRIAPSANFSQDGTGAIAWLDLSTGTIVSQNSGFIGANLTITTEGSWWKVSYTMPAIATATSTIFQVNTSPDGSTTIFTGDVTKGVAIWGLQLTESSSVKTYRKTEAVAEGGGFVTTWYDQSLNIVNATQTALTNQPIQTQNGIVVKSGSKPAIQGGSTLGLKTTIQNLSAITDFWMFFVVDVTDTTTVQTLFETSTNFNNTNSAILVYIQSGLIYVGQRISSANFSVKSYPISTGRQLISVRFRTGQTASNTSEVWINGNSVSGTVTLSNNSISLTSNQPLHFFARAGSSIGFLGKYQLVVMYGSDQSSNRVGIETKINEYYGIY